RRKSTPMRTENPRESTIVEAFERSRIPQAILSVDGVITFANKAFLKLLGRAEAVDGHNVTTTSLASVVPGLMRALAAVHAGGKPAERRAQVYRGDDKPSLELVLWFCPLPMTGNDVHLMVRVEER